jgi:hypothetical protein
MDDFPMIGTPKNRTSKVLQRCAVTLKTCVRDPNETT